jgi:phage tail tape-measure protein
LRKLSFAFFSALVALALTATVALAGGSAHFIKSATSASIDSSSGALVATFKEAGLASGATETIVLSATNATATYQCFNNGGNHPKATNKETVSTSLTSTGTFTADKNGNITGTLSLGTVPAGDFSCPSGQTLSGPTNVSYTNVSLVDTTPDPDVIGFSGRNF